MDVPQIDTACFILDRLPYIIDVILMWPYLLVRLVMFLLSNPQNLG